MSEVPQTMRAAVLYDVGDIRIERVPVPRLGTGDVLVRTGASGICSGDLMPWYVRRKAPFVFGHEPAGTIVALGSGADEELLGARVFAHHHAPCFACAHCTAGNHVQCATWRSSALEPGGMAEYFRVPHANVSDMHVLPGDMPFVAGALVEPLACVVKSMARGAGLTPPHIGAAEEAPLAGVAVYVVGLGVMGMMHVALARALGATVFASDFLPQRRAHATALGALAFEPADAVEGVRTAAPRDGADLVICGPGTAQALEHAVDAAGRGGAVVMFTPLEPGAGFVFDQNRAYFRDLRLIASYSCGPADTAAALHLLATGVVSPAGLGVTTVALDAVGTAYAAMVRRAVLKPIVVF